MRRCFVALFVGASCVSGGVDNPAAGDDDMAGHHHHHDDTVGDPGGSDSTADVDGDSDVSGDSDGGDVDVPEVCTTFCTCMAANCADKVFPTDCLSACTQHHAKWDMPCRQNMCNLVPPQPNNNHCTHAMGEFECLDLR